MKRERREKEIECVIEWSWKTCNDVEIFREWSKYLRYGVERICWEKVKERVWGRGGRRLGGEGGEGGVLVW